MQRPFLSQSPKRVGSGPDGPPDSLGLGSGAGACCASLAFSSVTAGWAFGTGANSARIGSPRPYEIPDKTKMSKPVGIDLGAGVTALGVLAFRGPDAARFLQGQLSAEIEKLAVGASTLAGLHNPQGRVIAVLALAR